MTGSVIIGMQWGDEGKGKIVDYVSSDYDSVVRYNGGPNAGHTVYAGAKSFTFHQVPSGAFQGKELFIAPGVVIDPVIFSGEVKELKEIAGDVKLMLDYRSTVITPADRELDRRIEELKGAESVGTTLRGIGPSYSSRALRISPTVGDVIRGKFNSDIYGKLYSIDFESQSWIESSRRALEGYAGDVREALLERLERRERVLFESAQGTLLDPLYGTYPYVTSSHTTAGYAAVSSGIPSKMVNSVIGVMKAYTTRVGKGPMPTELLGVHGDAVRQKGHEYGATTGRPRRVGWVDLPLLRYSAEVNGIDEIMITKIDVLSGLKELKVAVAYRINGEEMDRVRPSAETLEAAEPVYEELEPIPEVDWKDAVKGNLPVQVRKYIDFLEDRLKTRVSTISAGPEREMTLKLG